VKRPRERIPHARFPPRAVIFALDMDDGTLLAFAADGEAAARCKAVDVEDGFWRFYADDGSPLEARFFRPDGPGPGSIPSAYVLQRAMSGLWLQERLGQVRRIEGCGLELLEEVEEILKVNRGRRVALDRSAMRGLPGESP
jgi:hypothetical protein